MEIRKIQRIRLKILLIRDKIETKFSNPLIVNIKHLIT